MDTITEAVWRCTFPDGSHFFCTAIAAEAARVRARIEAWLVTGLWLEVTVTPYKGRE